MLAKNLNNKQKWLIYIFLIKTTLCCVKTKKTPNIFKLNTSWKTENKCYIVQTIYRSYLSWIYNITILQKILLTEIQCIKRVKGKEIKLWTQQKSAKREEKDLDTIVKYKNPLYCICLISACRNATTFLQEFFYNFFPLVFFS